MKITEKNIEELIEADYNPRKISGKQMNELKKSISKFGLTEPVLINSHKGRENVIISGHQRLKACKQLGIEKIPCYVLDLTIEKEKELNVRMNKVGGDFDFDILVDHFQRDFLLGIGFTEGEIGKLESEFDQKFNEFDNSNAEMPIVKEFNEDYNLIMIFCDNEMDFNWLRNVLELETMKEYKNKRTGESLVITVKKFQQIWERETSEN